MRPLVTRPTRRRLAADAALVVVSAAFMIPPHWLAMASVDTEATLRLRTPESPTLDNFSAGGKEDLPCLLEDQVLVDRGGLAQPDVFGPAGHGGHQGGGWRGSFGRGGRSRS
ncbi:hypothetical protein [Streptomyces sp. NPDC051776]|uniref:hypothetical protein n=1 Tax=Streptomyces sp. NPDC051776 TaxID=3155414 RepID=UPI00341303F5